MIRHLQTLLADLWRIAAMLRIVIACLIGAWLRRMWRGRAAVPWPVTIRRILERLGTTSVKLGQFMAMRFDLLPIALCDELQLLFEHVPPLPYPVIRAAVESELGAPITALFADVDPHPIGAASIAQVHRATGHGGESFAIKIRRPGIARRLAADMRALQRLAGWIDRLGLFPGLSLAEMAAEFAGFTRRELDFLREGLTAERLRAARTRHETVPRIHWPLTTQAVLTMDFIDGLSIAATAQLLARGHQDVVAARLPGFAAPVALRHFASASLHQLFGTGFFHADPHPGNILVMADNRIAFIDFGIFGHLSAAKRALLIAYTESAATGDTAAAYAAFIRLSQPTGRTDMAAYRRAAVAHLTHWYQTSLIPGAPQPHIGELIGEMTDIMRRHHVRIDLETLLFWRAVIALDSSALTLSAEFDLAAEIRRYFAANHPRPLAQLRAAALDPGRMAAMASLIAAVPRVAAANPLRVVRQRTPKAARR